MGPFFYLYFMRIDKVFLYLYLLIGFLPAFGAVDKVGFQWLYLSVLNIIFLLHSFGFKKVIFVPKNSSFYSLLIFFIISIISLISSFNNAEYTIEIFRYATLITSLLVLFNISKSLNLDINKFQSIISIILFFEVLYFFGVLWYDSTFYGIINLKGVSSNINIQAFSIILKLPFAFLPFFSSNFKRSFLNIISIWLSISILFIISSRASFLSLLIITAIFLFWKFNFLKNLIIISKLYILPIFVTTFILNPLLKTDSKLSSLTIINESSLTRLQFYKEALASIFQNPFFGVGAGNWKLFGIEAHKENVIGYTIPYHAHNDFLQLGAEIGIFGLLAYILFFFFLFLILKNLINSINKVFTLSLFLTLFVYLIDANLNFPISRPLIQIQFLFIIAFVYLLFENESKNYSSINKLHILLILFFGLGSIYTTYKVYDSFTKQQYLLSDFQSQKFDTPLEVIESIDDDFPNIGATALPIKSIKANYYNDPKIIASLLDQASKDNPFIKYPQALKSIRFRADRALDSSLYYAKDAFEGLPFNELHIINYFSILTELNDSITIDSVFQKVKKIESYNILNSYILANLTMDRNPVFLNNVIKDAVSKYPNDNKFMLYELRASKGDSIIKLANNLFREAENYFNNNEFVESAETYIEASKFIPEDPAYLENAAHGYYMANQNNKALQLFDSVINNYSSKTGKSEYLKGLMLVETKNNFNQACDLFRKSFKKGNQDASKAIKLFCQ